jgi:DNA invertase Pin-like site-specific DNA recombinase
MDASSPIPKPHQAVAQYVRMSTEHQQYSTENQSLSIFQYAQAHNVEIVRTYSDHGKSGLSLSGRAGLAQLLADVESGEAEITAVLVYDVSRWGQRFLEREYKEILGALESGVTSDNSVATDSLRSSV